MSLSAVITIVFTVVYHECTVWLVRKMKLTTKDICAASATIAMTVVLESILIPLPTGATISLLSPIPLLLLALLWDYKLAMLSGWICGVLVMLLVPGWQLVHWGQFLVEHLVCFSCLGYAGIMGHHSRWKMICGVLLASVLKITGHILSGALFFSQNAWDGWGAWGYTLAYNLSANVPLCGLSAMIVLLLPLPTIYRAIKGGKT